MADLPTIYTSSDGRRTPLKEMAYTHLQNAIRKREREDGGLVTPMLAAMRAELESRPAPEPKDRSLPMAGEEAATPAEPAAGVGHNRPPEPTLAEYEASLAETHSDILDLNARAELAAGKLPKAEDIKTDEQLAAIDAWIAGAARVAGEAEKTRERIKDPWLRRGQAVDRFFGGIRDSLRERIKGMEARKKPYLLAKAARERAELEAQRVADAEAAERLRRQEAAERERAAAAQAEADEAAARLRAAEAERAAQEAAALSQAEADDSAPDLSQVAAAGSDVDAAEEEVRRSLAVASNAAAAANLAGQAAQISEAQAAANERALAAPTHLLAKTGTSGLKSVWRHRIARPLAFLQSLGPLGPFLSESEVDLALKRAAKSESRPAIPGIEYFEDFEATTARTPRA